MTEQRPEPASPEMARKLAINRTGRLTPGQRRTALIAGLVTLGFLLCPTAMLLQLGVAMVTGDLPAPTPVGIGFTLFGLVFMLLFFGLFGGNVMAFLPEALGRRPVRYARGPLIVHMTQSERPRPELPFSFIVGDYSFAPYIPPRDISLRPGAPYIVYYSSRSRLLLSMAALDAPDAAEWEPQFENPPR